MEENQPSVITVRDDEGRLHYTSPHSKLAKKYAKPAEVADATVDAPAGDDRDARSDDSGSGQRKRAGRHADSSVRGSVQAEPESGS